MRLGAGRALDANDCHQGVLDDGGRVARSRRVLSEQDVAGVEAACLATSSDFC